MKTAESTIQIRIDTKTKNASRKILEEIGLDMSTAVKMFLRKVVADRSIPLDFRTEGKLTLKQEKEIISIAEQALKNGKKYLSLDELKKDLSL